MRINVNNITLAYEDYGSGIPLLFIHGYPLNRHIWDLQMSGLSDVAHVLAPDLRGHGESEAVPGPYWMDLLAEDLNAFLDALGVTRPVVVAGLSMGGYIAMAFYRQFAPRMAGIILAATRAGADTPEAKENRDKAAAQARNEGKSGIIESMLEKMLAPNTYRQQPELVERVRAIMESVSLEGMLGDLAGMKERPDSTHTLEEIELPALVIHGADDQIIPVKEAERMKESLSNGHLEILPDAGHLISLEQPDLFNQAVRRFVQSL